MWPSLEIGVLYFKLNSSAYGIASCAQYHELAGEAFYLLAIVYDKLGYLEEREKAAALFKVHIMALENPEEKEDSLSTML